MDYVKLFKDKKEGKLNDDMVIIMDNDCGYWSCNDFYLSESKRNDLISEYEDKYGLPEGYEDIVEVLNAAGIEAEWC